MSVERWRRRIAYWLNSEKRTRELHEEMSAHLEMKIEELIAEGMSAAAARREAHRQFGNATLHHETSRGTWIARWWSDLLQDGAFAGRTLRKQPGFTIVAVLSAALGIGACSLIFGLVNSALFRPLPVAQPSRLLSLSGIHLTKGRSGQSLAYPDIVDLRQARTFRGIAAFSAFTPATISSNGEPQRYWGSIVTANYFEVVQPVYAIGHGFDATKDDRPGEPAVVVLGHQLWQSRFGGDPSIVGKQIELNSRTVMVVGVTGPGFRGTERLFYSDFWLPFSMSDTSDEFRRSVDRFEDRGGQWLQAVARLQNDVSESAAAAEVDVIGGRLRAQYPSTNRERAFHLERAGQVNPGFRQVILVLFLALLLVALLVLCTACANIANLLLARASARRQEVATRLAIGAGRGRIVRQLLTESVLLGLLGGAGGYAIAELGAGAIGRSRIPLALPVDFTVSLDYRVVLFCASLSVLTGIVFGLLPALRATQPDLVGPLKNGRSSISSSRRFSLRNGLVVAQVAICMVLLISAGLFLRSLKAASAIEIGFSHRNLLMLAFDPSLNRYPPQETQRIVNAMIDRAGALPGVESIALTNSVPLSMEGTQNGFVPEDKVGQPGSGIIADIYAVGPGFFDTFGIRILAGEDFRRGDSADDIAIVNEALVAKAFSQPNAVGRRIQYFGKMIRIIGVVATTKSRSIGEDPRPCLYFPIERNLRGNDSQTGMTLVLRTAGSPEYYTNVVRQQIHEVDPRLPLFDVRTMDTHLWRAMYFPRLTAVLFGMAGLMGLLIATIGIYGVISFTVARQTKEIGIRMALGATRSQVVRRIVVQGLAVASIGAGIGIGLALALSRVTASLLYGVSTTDTVTFLAVPSALLLIALTACLIPARRAASLDPVCALRAE